MKAMNAFKNICLMIQCFKHTNTVLFQKCIKRKFSAFTQFYDTNDKMSKGRFVALRFINSYSCRINKNLFFKLFNIGSIKIQSFIVVMLSRNNLPSHCPWFGHRCLFIITKILQNLQFENFNFSQMTFREITCQNSTDTLNSFVKVALICFL